MISGHDLKDLFELLKQTEGKGINIYTHGEMLPANGYPELKKYPHFYGHFGTAWQNQHKEFAHFPGAILMTTNCLQKPLDSYKANIFTCGLVGWQEHIPYCSGNSAPEIKGPCRFRDLPQTLRKRGHDPDLREMRYWVLQKK